MCDEYQPHRNADTTKQEVKNMVRSGINATEAKTGVERNRPRPSQVLLAAPSSLNTSIIYISK